MVRTGWLGETLAFARSAEEPVRLSRRAVIADAVLAGFALAASLTAAVLSYRGNITEALVAAVIISAALAARRRYPMTVFLVILATAVAARDSATDVTFILVIIAGYSAATSSRFRGAAQLSLVPAGLLMAVAFWSARDRSHLAPGAVIAVTPVGRLRPPGFPGRVPDALLDVSAPWRLAGVLVLVSLASITVVAAASHAADRIRRLRSEHEAATRQAIAGERARIASELHDVVTHSVTVMLVQAGAARQVLAREPDEARKALLAVESSGRAAITELRHLLGLLSPPGPEPAAGDAAPAPAGTGDLTADHELRPQPGLGQLGTLTGRLAAAGLPVELRVSDLPEDLPPGVDLAAYRVVQEALTNVIKHAGKPRTTVNVGRQDGGLVLEITDAGRAFPAVAPAAVGGSGRGLLGLRERLALYGGDIEAGPRPGGGWMVRARIPMDPSAGTASPAAPGRPRLAAARRP